MKKIAVLGASTYNINVYKKLKSEGFYTLAIDGNQFAEAALFADKFIHVDYSDIDKLIAVCQEHKIDAIMPINEWGVMPAAKVVTELGLIGNSEKTALLATDKGLMRQTWKEHKVAGPDFIVFKTLEELKIGLQKIGFPCVVKPTFSGGGGRGISVLKSIEDAEWAFEFALPAVKYGTLICEEFIEGTELTVETISVDGEVFILAMSDKEKPELRTRVATSLNYPANISEEQRIIVEETVKKAVLALGIISGMAHSEVILNGTEVKMVETGARGGGSHIFPLIIEAVSGINTPVVFAHLLTGKKPNLSNIQRNGVVYRFLNPPHGILKEVKGVEEVRNWSGILDVGVTKKNGEEVGNLKNSLERAGFVVASGKDRNTAQQLANKAELHIKFDIDPI
ncbi:MAG: ATP-grasp domain-containing protein [Bacteroidota bacterium]|nr:ATP-grasp domain-containing protein [Bacteroidota bacterium]